MQHLSNIWSLLSEVEAGVRAGCPFAGGHPTAVAAKEENDDSVRKQSHLGYSMSSATPYNPMGCHASYQNAIAGATFTTARYRRNCNQAVRFSVRS